MVGVNKYINEDENMSAAIEKPITKGVEKRKTLIKPIVSRRYAEVIEKDRLNNENH
jgi:methylmalonyl-CoA mutase